jgi:hypothetical protein
VIRPSGSDCVRFGLLRAARLNPLYIQPDEVPALVRMALYDSPLGEKVDPTTANQVVQRAQEALELHLADETNDFDRWFNGSHNSFNGQIAKRKRAPGGKLKRDVVHKGLFEQGWRAYQYVADCVHTAFYLFRQLLPVPLNVLENRVFERMYLKQKYFGDLPSLMLTERFPQLQPILTNVWEDEDNTEAVAIMHRLLEYYAEMAPERRSADRRTQSRKKGTQRKEHITVDVELPTDELIENKTRMTTPNKGLNVLEDLADKLRLAKGISCGCKNPDWGMRSNGIDGEEAKVTLHCRTCSFENSCCVSLTTLRRMGEA